MKQARYGFGKRESEAGERVRGQVEQLVFHGTLFARGFYLDTI
jgi:hypothetical protein